MVRWERWPWGAFVAVVLWLAAAHPLAAQQIQVTSATPSAAPQGTINLNVVIAGNGFDKGAKAQFFVTGTTNPGGITVNSTAFSGKTQLTANITIADNAVLANFDVQVTSGTRTGKGTELFAVTPKGTPIGCTTPGTPSGFTLVTVLNPVQANGAALLPTTRLGNAIRVRPLDLNGDGIVDSLAAFNVSGSGSGSTPGTYVFLLDPVTGQVQPRNPVSGTAWQNPLLLLTGVRATHAAAGDVNGDGIPDFVMGGADSTAYLFVGSITGGTLGYTAYQILPPPGAPKSWAAAVALGDLDGNGQDEILIDALPAAKRDPSIPAVFIFKYGGGTVNYVEKIQDPTGSQTSSFGGGLYGGAVAVGNVDGNPGNELVVGAKAANGGNGTVYIFPYPAQQASYFTLTGPGPNFGEELGIADVNLDSIPDLVVITGGQFGGSATTAQALVFAGSVHPGSVYTNQLLPAAGLSYSWAAPNSDVGDMLTAGVVAVGTPNASSCNSIQGGIGAVHLFTSPFAASQQANYVFGPPTLAGSSQFEFGYGVGVAPGYPFLLVGAHFQDVGTTTTAGQVYVYKKD